MDVLEITIWHRLETGWPVVAEHTRPGELPRRSEDTLALNDGFEEELIALALQPREYGEYLGRALFHGEVRATFDKAVGNRETPLRVLLVVEAPELKPLRWERLCAPLRSGGKWDFLILNQSTPYSLYLPSLTDRRFPAIGRRDLRALVVLADPPPDNRHGLARFDAQATADSVHTALGEIPHDILGAASDSLGPATLDELCARITSQHYSLLHVVAHGGFRQADGETILYLLDPEGQLAPVTATQVIEQLDRLGGRRGLPHLCFLATCESASPEAEGALGGLAQRLVRELGIPAVVAMTEKVSIDTAQALAGAFYRSLRETGLVDQALVESVAALQRRHDVTVPALFSRLGGRPLFSDQLGERQQLTDGEIHYGLERIEGLLPERAPVLRPELGKHAQTLRDTLGADPEALSDASRKARHDALEALNALSEEALDLSFPAVALDQPIPAYDARCPFPGLKAFQTDEREFFFGREKKVEELRGRLTEERFLAVLGGSGSGKSSLVLAGMIPSLEDEARQSGRQLQVRYLTPGATPEAALAGQLDPALPADQPTLLVVDQFEELFTLCLDPSKRKGFLDALVGAWTDQPNLLIVLTLRADFWGDCAPYPSIKALMQAHQELLAPMTTPELRSAMEQQAARVGLRFEADLSHSILAEVEGEPGAMPLLQHLLLELWNRRHGRWLKASEYRALGGIRQAIAHTADAIYGDLQDDPQAQSLLRNIFVRLTRLDDATDDHDQHRDTRQRVALEDLVPLNADANRIRALVKQLADARLVVTTTDATTNTTQVEVSHEALIRYWPRLRTWLDKDRESWMLLAAVRQHAKDWQQNGKRPADLPRWGERLQQADVLFKQPRFVQSKLEQEFLAAAKELAQQERSEKELRERREREALAKAKDEAERAQKAAERAAHAQRGKTRASLIGLGVAIALLIGASYFWYDSANSRRIAEHQKNIALTGQSLFLTELGKQQTDKGDVGTAILLGLEALPKNTAKPDRPYVFEAEAQLYDSLAKLREYAVLKEHRGRVTFAAFSPDGREVLTASHDGTARLWDTHTGEQLAELTRHGGRVAHAAFSPDGRYIATASVDSTVRLWSGSSGAFIRLLTDTEFRGEDAYHVAFSPDGDRVVAAFSWKGAGLWNANTGDKIATLPIRGIQGQEYVVHAVFSPDGRRIVTSDRFHGTGQIWDGYTGDHIATLSGHEKGHYYVTFTHDGSLILSASADKTARVWDASDGKQLVVLRGHGGKVFHADFSPDGQKIVTASEDHTARVWHIGGQELALLKGHMDEVRHAAFSPDGQYVITASRDDSTRLWDSETGELIALLAGHSADVTHAAFSSDGQRIVTTGDETARLWKAKADTLVTVLPDQERSLSFVAFSPDGKRLLTAPGGWVAENNDTVRLWDVGTWNEAAQISGEDFQYAAFSPKGTFTVTVSGKDGLITLRDGKTDRVIREFKGHRARVMSAAFSPDERLVATGAADFGRRDNTIRLWDVTSGRQIEVLRGHTSMIFHVAFSPDGKRLISCSQNMADTRLWDVDGRKLIRVLPNGGMYAAFSPDSGRVVTAANHNNMTAQLWSADNGEWIKALEGHEADTTYAVFSPDGQRIITTSTDFTARLWDADTGEQLHVLRGHKDTVNHAAFSDDSRRVVTSSGRSTFYMGYKKYHSNDNTARVWDVETGKPLAVLKGHEYQVRSAAFSPDGSLIATASEDKTARIWTLFPSSQALIDYARSVAPRQLTQRQRVQFFLTEDSESELTPDTTGQ